MDKRIIVNPEETVQCPACSHEFPLREGIARQTLDGYQEEFESALARERRELQAELERQAERRAAKAYSAELERLKELAEQAQQSEARARQAVQQAGEKAAAEARAELQAAAEQLKAELEAKDRRLAEFRDQELALRKEKQALAESRQELELQMQRRLDEAREQINAKAEETHKLKEAEYRKKIEDAQKANDELKRKLEQGSQQLQGEVLELELEDLLRAAFPFDRIDAVRTGARGADLVQTVHTRSGTFCGRIIWEAKRAENWSNIWIAKLKDDQQAANAEIPVLVTTAMPGAATEPFVQHEGVWVVRPTAARAMAEVLRSLLIETQKQRVVNAGKNEKMEALYDYLCSAQFAQKIRGVVDAYAAMREDLEKEKAAMARLWKKREAQLERITTNMMGMCGELQGIAEDALPQLESVGALDPAP